MRYRAIHFHLDYVAMYNRIIAGVDPLPKRNGRTLGVLEKRKNEHEAKAAALLHAGMIRGSGGMAGNKTFGQYERTEKHINGWYEKVTAAKNAKRVAAGLEPYRAVGNAKKPRKR